jgi:hypothetical protein
MSAENLIAEAKRLIDRAESGLKKIENAEPTQLRIAVRRLELFLEQHGITGAPEKEQAAELEVEPAEESTLADAKPEKRPKGT